MGKTKSRSGSLLDDVHEAMSQLRPRGPLPWYERVADEHREELAVLKAAWREGKLGSQKEPLARNISAKLRERGIATIGTQGVLAWLEKA